MACRCWARARAILPPRVRHRPPFRRKLWQLMERNVRVVSGRSVVAAAAFTTNHKIDTSEFADPSYSEEGCDGTLDRRCLSRLALGGPGPGPGFGESGHG